MGATSLLLDIVLFSGSSLNRSPVIVSRSCPPNMGGPCGSSLSLSRHSWSGCCQYGKGLPNMEKGLDCSPPSHTRSSDYKLLRDRASGPPSRFTHSSSGAWWRSGEWMDGWMDKRRIQSNLRTSDCLVDRHFVLTGSRL